MLSLSVVASSKPTALWCAAASLQGSVVSVGRTVQRLGSDLAWRGSARTSPIDRDHERASKRSSSPRPNAAFTPASKRSHSLQVGSTRRSSGAFPSFLLPTPIEGGRKKLTVALPHGREGGRAPSPTSWSGLLGVALAPQIHPANMGRKVIYVVVGYRISRLGLARAFHLCASAVH
jgi:hypothetical protein